MEEFKLFGQIRRADDAEFDDETMMDVVMSITGTLETLGFEMFASFGPNGTMDNRGFIFPTKEQKHVDPVAMLV